MRVGDREGECRQKYNFIREPTIGRGQDSYKHKQQSMGLPTPHPAIPRVEPKYPHNCHCGWNEEEPDCPPIDEKPEHHGCRGKEFAVKVRCAQHREIVLPDV